MQRIFNLTEPLEGVESIGSLFRDRKRFKVKAVNPIIKRYSVSGGAHGEHSVTIRLITILETERP